MDELLTTARAWLAAEPDVDLRDELGALIVAAERGDATELRVRFDGRLQFGTAGLRGELGPGPNRMNRVVVSRAAAGLAGYTQATYYLNAWDQRTDGVDIVGRKKLRFDVGTLDLTAAASFLNTATRNVNRTTEISADWSSIGKIYEAVIPRIRAEINGITLLGGHSSHSYINGTNMYFNYFYDLIDCAPEEENDKYYFKIIDIICEETLRYGGSIVHHHGIGKARAKWAAQEYGSSYSMLTALKQAFDPNGVMNVGTVIPK